MIRMCSYPRDHRGVLLTGLVLLSMALAPYPAWGQWQTSGANIYYNNGNVGIGTPAPGVPLTVQSSSPYSIQMYNPTAASYTQLLITGNNHEYHIGMGGSAEGGYGVANKLFFFDSQANAMRMTIDSAGNVGIGTTNPGAYKLAVEGTIGARDVMVTSAPWWPDYVFRPGYRLQPLSEVKAYIQQHHHLPDIPNEAEVKEEGVSVGEMQAKLLTKIEELTLHMIQQDRDNREVREQMRQQQREDQELRERIAQLERRSFVDVAPAAKFATQLGGKTK